MAVSIQKTVLKVWRILNKISGCDWITGLYTVSTVKVHDGCAAYTRKCGKWRSERAWRKGCAAEQPPNVLTLLLSSLTEKKNRKCKRESCVQRSQWKLVQLADGPIIIHPVTRAGRKKHTTKNYTSINVTLKAMPTGASAPDRSTHVGKAEGERPDKSSCRISGC
jgi:hypothetical protein